MNDTITAEAVTYRASHVMEVQIPAQDIADLLDMAGYGIAYWARKATINEDAGTYRVWLQDAQEVGHDADNRTLEFEWIAKMIVRLAAGDASLTGINLSGDTAMNCRRYVGSLLASEGDPDFDAFDADVLVQLCYFRGEVVYA